MDSSSIRLPESEIATIALSEGQLRIHFARAYIVKTMTGSVEQTLWWQAGDLILDGAEPTTPLPSGPCVCAGGDIEDNIYTYRDMIPIPLISRGHARCVLRCRAHETPLIATGHAIRLELHDVPKYLRHLRPGTNTSD